MRRKEKISVWKTLVAAITAVLFLLPNCTMFQSMNGSDDDKASIDSLTFSKTSLTLQVGEMDYLKITMKPSSEQKSAVIKWSYDSTVISCDTTSNYGVTITAVKEGKTSLRCSYGGVDATCIITVSGYAENYEESIEPYIYSNTTVLQTSPGITEKIYVSLYGGDAGDIDGYTWTVDNSSVASIQPTGQYCYITAKNSGYTRIKVTHTKASYPYYIGVYVFADATNVSYITTSTNILTMNQSDGEQSITCSLVNGLDSSRDSSFTWSIVSQDSTSVPITLAYNGNNAVITPKTSGSCTVRIEHPDAAYPLDILCRVITVVKNVYISPDSTVVYINGTEEKNVTCTLENISAGDYSVDDYDFTVDNLSCAEIYAQIGNRVILNGVGNGSTKLIVSHPKAAYSREILLIVTGQIKDAIDSSCYITTTQNYVKTKVGADSTTVRINLKGGEDGDENNFVWTVKSTPADENSSSDVIKLETTTGSAVHTIVRAASLSYAYGTAIITPLAEGTAVIEISHPKIVYTTEILVKVLGKDAILEEPLEFSGSGLVRILNGEQYTYTISLNGDSKTGSDEKNIKWSNDDTRISVAGNGTVAVITAPAYGMGQTISHVTASHSKAEADKDILVMTADTEEELAAMKALYSDKLYYNLNIGDTATAIVQSVGFNSTGNKEDDGEDSDTVIEDDYDFSTFSWTTTDSTMVSIEKNTAMPLYCQITALKSGSCKLTGSIDGYSVTFTITVYPEGAIQTAADVYLSTSQNVVNLSGAGATSTVKVTAKNLSAGSYSDIVWKSSCEAVATVQPNGVSATFTAISEGETIVTVTHPDSANTLKIYVRVGSEYVIQDAEPVVYISAPDVITLLKDDSAQKSTAVLVNYDGVDTSGFSFSIDNENVAKLSSFSTNGIFYVKPVDSGQAEITITHSACSFTKKVLVVVGNSSEELAGYTYLTTSQNVVAIGEGNTKSVSVSVKNAASVVVNGYNWVSSNPSAISITSTSGATAVLKGNSIGTAIITVTNDACTYSLQIIAQCVDPIAASASPYIQLSSSVMNLTVSSTYSSITADLVGGSSEDYSTFVWTSNDSSILAVYGQNEVGKVRALKAGTTYITVSHPKASYSAQILVICDTATESECSISVPSSIITMKPTDSSQTITATLINGSTNDKYNFTWSLDVYDVIDFNYSANVCTITPKQTGSVTITIHHPKAAYDQQILVTVQQYTTFSFPNDSMTITQGDVQFINMQVPTTTVTTYVEYSTENANIVSISGTKSVAQLTAVGTGTTTVKARLIASSTGVEQASAEMMVYVKEKDTTSIYISANTTIYTVNKGKSQSISAILTGTGVTNSDQYDLVWSTSDTDVVSVTGVSSDGTVTGSSIYVTALAAGEAIITCTHPKAASALKFYVVVPGTGTKTITFNKSYMTITKGSSGSTLKATIENAESNDYNNLIWNAEGANGEEICRVMGSGQNVTIYPIKVGQSTVTAQLPDSESVAKCTVIVEATKSLVFETSSRKVQPFHSKIVKYTVSPADAVLSWTVSQDDDYFEYADLGCDDEGNGQLEITGIKEGNGTIACVTDGGAKAQCTVKVAWDYEFSVLGTTTFSMTPVETKELEFTVSPVDSRISVESTDAEVLFNYTIVNKGDGTGSVIIQPISESNGNVYISVVARNPNKNLEEVGSQQITAKFVYPTLNLRTSYVGQKGNFSYWSADNNSLTLGDGEQVTLDFGIEESMSNGTVSNVEFAPVQDAISGVNITLDNTTENGRSYSIAESGGDYEKQVYFIKEAWAPTYNGSTVNSWTTNIHWYISDSCQDPHGQSIYLASSTFSTFKRHNDEPAADATQWLKRKFTTSTLWPGANDGTKCSRIRIYTYDNTEMDISDFRSIAWFYFPGATMTQKFDYNTLILPQNGTVNSSYFSTCGSVGNIWTPIASYVGIVSQNVSAELRTTTSKTVLQSDLIGSLKITITHNGKTQTPVSIPVYYEKRGCTMTQE